MFLTLLNNKQNKMKIAKIVNILLIIDQTEHNTLVSKLLKLKVY
jgi:hypothetical protein